MHVYWFTEYWYILLNDHDQYQYIRFYATLFLSTCAYGKSPGQVLFVNLFIYIITYFRIIKFHFHKCTISSIWRAQFSPGGPDDADSAVADPNAGHHSGEEKFG